MIRQLMKTPCWKRFHRSDSGGVAVEFAIISVLLVLGSLGAVEFGRALQLRNELSSVADRAAREILMDSEKTSTTAHKATAIEKVRTYWKGPNPQLLQIALVDDTIDGRMFRKLTLSYPVALLIPQLARSPINLRVERHTPVT